MPHGLILLTGNNSLTLPGFFAVQSLNRQARSRTVLGCARPGRRSRQDPP